MASGKSSGPAATQIQVTVSVSNEAMEFARKNAKNGDVAGTISSWCGYFLENQSRGGICLEPEDHQYLADLAGGKRFKDSRSLVRAVEKGINREEGQYCIKINVDPAHYPALKENADQSGLTVEESVQGIVQMIFASGWIYDFTPRSGRAIPFTAEMIEQTSALLNKHDVDSKDIAGLIAENRFMPITRETAAKAKLVTGKLEFTGADLDGVLAEIESLRAQVKKLNEQVLVAA